ncbi:MAG: double zinc ribbon domain-containing protein [Gemmatimonadaceae bacterium]
MRRQPAAASVGGAIATDDEIEAAVRAYRAGHASCPSCGPRPEPDAVYCSTCGRYLRDRCADCGAPVEALDARYCVNCGHRLAA